MQQPFDRAREDLGNSIHLEHVNVRVPDQRLATLFYVAGFYVAGLGLARDPYLLASDTNMWVNVGRSRLRNSEIVRKSGGSPATIIMKSARSTAALAICRDE